MADAALMAMKPADGGAAAPRQPQPYVVAAFDLGVRNLAMCLV
jgi:hypothetical protein